jgi:hypothetical protein
VSYGIQPGGEADDGAVEIVDRGVALVGDVGRCGSRIGRFHGLFLLFYTVLEVYPAGAARTSRKSLDFRQLVPKNIVSASDKA